ncbi:MAG: hypothetical protein PHN63_00755 [Candidatus Omnitrophica bacterium]|nr:hypothetical protein [Candidatus Omnitrophota bacterium]
MVEREAGGTLVELMVAVLLVAIAVLVSFQFLFYCDKLAMKATARVVAANYDRETIEKLYMLDYYNPALDPTPDDGFTDPLLGIENAPARTYKVTEQTDYKIIEVWINAD